MDQKIIDAVRFYWDSRNSQKDKQVNPVLQIWEHEPP